MKTLDKVVPPYALLERKILRIPSNCFSKCCPVVVFAQLLDKRLKLLYSDFLDVLFCHHCTRSSPELETTLLVKKTTGM